MPIYNVKAPDGKIYKVQGPENADEGALIETLYNYLSTAKPAPSTERTALEAVTDVPASVLKGIGSMAQLPGQVYGLATGDFDTAAMRGPKKLQEYAESLKSKGLQTREALQSAAISEAAKNGIASEFLTAVTSTLKDPALISSFVAETVPQLLPALLTGGAYNALSTGARQVAKYGTKEAAEAAAAKGAARVAIGTGATQQGASVGTDTYTEALALAEKQYPNMPLEERQALALSKARATALQSGAISVGAQFLPGGAAIERRMAGLPGEGRIRSALGESASEIVEEGGGKFASNVNLQQIDPTRSLTEGVGQAAGMGAIGGGVLGGAIGRGAPAAPLQPGQNQGENLEQTATRLQREILNAQKEITNLRQSTLPEEPADQLARANNELVALAANSQPLAIANQIQTEQAAAQAEGEQNAARFVAPTGGGSPAMAVEPTAGAAETIDGEIDRGGVVPTGPDVGVSVGGEGTAPAAVSVELKELANQWDQQNKNNRSDAWFEGAKANEAAISGFIEALQNNGQNLPTHGMAKESTLSGAINSLLNIFQNGLDTSRGGGKLYHAPLVTALGSADSQVSTTPGGSAYSDGPFMLVARPGQEFEGNLSGVGAVLVNQSHAEIVPELRKAVQAIRPDIIVEAYSNAGQVVKQLNTASQPTAEVPDVTAFDVEVPTVEQPAATTIANVPLAEAPAEVTTAAQAPAVEEQKPAKVVTALNPEAQTLLEKVDQAIEVADTPQAPKGHTFNYEGRTFRIPGTPAALLKFKSTTLAKEFPESFQDAQAPAAPPVAPPAAPTAVQPTPEIKNIITGMIDDGDVESAISYADVHNVNIEDAFKGDTARLSEIQSYRQTKESLRQKPEGAQPAQGTVEAPKETLAELEARKAENTKQIEAAIAEKKKQLTQVLKAILTRMGLKDVSVKLIEDINSAEEGSYADRLMRIAVDADNPLRVLRHETIHALKELGFFTDSQWKSLTDQANKVWIDKYLKNVNVKYNGKVMSRYDAYMERENGNMEIIIEEAIADAFGDFSVKAPPGMLAAITARMKMLFQGMKSALNGTGFYTSEQIADQIFTKTAKGQLKVPKQAANQAAEPAEAKLSLRTIPDNKEFKQWSRDKPVIRYEETDEYKGGAAVFQAFHGTTHSNIETFDVYKGNKDGALGAGSYLTTSPEDASANYAGIGPDLTARIAIEEESLSESFYDDAYNASEMLNDYFQDNKIDNEVTDDNFDDLKDKYGEKAIHHAAQKALKGDSEGLVMPMYVRMLKPFDMRPNGLVLDFSYKTDDQGDPIADSEQGTLIDFLKAARNVLSTYNAQEEFISSVFDNGLDGISAKEIFDIATKTLSDNYDDNGDMVSSGHIIQEIAREAGYDGLIQDANSYFGTGRRGFGGLRVPSMAGVNEGVLHLMPFKDNQLKSAIGNKGTYSEKGNIKLSLREAKGVGYHSGDLGYGRDTALGRMSGRSTGHFGTGVYFVGSPDKISGRDDRPIQEVDLSGYKLYRPNDKESAKKLHDALKKVNTLRSMYRSEEKTQSREFEDDLDSAAFDLWIEIMPRKPGQNTALEKKDVSKIIRSNVIDAANEFEPVAFTSKYVDSASTRVMKALGFEGVDVRNIPDFDNTTYGTVVYAEKFKPKSVKFSLRSTLPQSTQASIDRITTAREEKGFIGRMMEAIAPTAFSKYRQQYLNRYNQLGRYDKMLADLLGVPGLLADASAEAAALMSDNGAGLTASALGVHDRVGGIPVFRNGVTIISNVNGTVAGPMKIFAKLTELGKGDPYIYQSYQLWAGAKRASRFNAQGVDTPYTAADLQEAKRLEGIYPEFVEIQKDWIKYNDGLVQYMLDTGIISKENAKKFVEHSDYIPFYRQLDGEETIGPKIFQSISGVKAPRKAKGSEAPLADFMETVVRNTQSVIQAGLKNTAAKQAVNVAMQLGPNFIVPLGHVSSLPSDVMVLENGLKKYYRSSDSLWIESLKALNAADLPFNALISGPANLLRTMVTKDPGFMLANMMRDSLAAHVTSGIKMTPIVDTIKNFTAAIAGQSPEFKTLLNAGLLGGYEFSQNIEYSGKVLEKELRKKTGTTTTTEKVLSPFTGLWSALEKGTTASDAATRIEVYKKTLAATNNEAEALFRAMEVMNFNRKGNSPVIRVITAAIPFLNARIQGLDVLYRAAFGQLNSQDAAKVQRLFFIRGAQMMALSCMYWALTHDDDEYKKQESETRDNYWLLPSLGIKIPIPFEIGILFKVIPERILAYSFGDDTGQDFMKSMARQLSSTLAVNPIPQAALPVVEAVTNHSFFTQRPIVGQGMEGVAPGYQVGPGTTNVAADIGKALNISPMKLDHMIKGYTGTIGMYLMDVVDSVYSMNSDIDKPSKRIDQLPVLKRFLIDPEARGTVTAFYEMKNAADQVVRTESLLERTFKFDARADYLQENGKMLVAEEYVKTLEKTMKQFREMKLMIRSSNMPSDDKRDALSQITAAENRLTSNIQAMKKALQ